MSDLRALIPPVEAADLLKMSLKTLRGHVKDGTLAVVVTGRGLKRRRYAIDPDDLEAFRKSRREYRGPPVEPTSRKSRRPASAVAETGVFDFEVRLQEWNERKRQERQARGR